ncbi:bifunctional 4-hydroxy-2-oxoglutarate aldolase/2-dehydro-3-deoxy-phosphogluconate aldolase [Candidatus Sumerlaeota bacterium]|nr:bifunctional 4-hydroxy-2-oxoglutarate aldolase/2-dehydro-3-deoxy-phosphogluconate aldolase [Candidatus Sumerlaeota bacterium]
MSTETLDKIKACRIVPVVTINDASLAVDVAGALKAGGLPCAEFTFRTAAAAEAISRASEAMPDVLIGAGTVLTPDQVRQAADAGAKFIVTPGFNPRVVEKALEIGVPIYPGVATPTDIEHAMSFGLQTLKYFPAEAYGGLKVLKTVAAPYSKLRFIPSGGINADNVKDYLAWPRTVACGGSWMSPTHMIDERRFDEITRLTKEAMALAAEVPLQK